MVEEKRERHCQLPQGKAQLSFVENHHKVKGRRRWVVGDGWVFVGGVSCIDKCMHCFCSPLPLKKKRQIRRNTER